MNSEYAALGEARKKYFAASLKSEQRLNAYRDRAWKKFLKLGLPSKNEEDYKYTSFTQLQVLELAPAISDIDRDWIKRESQKAREKDAFVLVLANGRLVAEHSDLVMLFKENIFVSQSASLLPEVTAEFQKLGRRARLGATDALDALNACYFALGLAVKIPPNKKLHKPIQLICLSNNENCASYSRAYFKVCTGGELELIETFVGAGQHLQSSHLELAVHRGARVSHAKSVNNSTVGSHTSRTRVFLGAQSDYQYLGINFGGKTTRHNHDVFHLGAGSKSKTLGATAISAADHADNHFSVFHLVGGCESDQYFKSAINGQARSVFTGRIFIAKDSQKAQAGQLSNSMLLSEKAESDSRPQLEIYADDVKANHGATVGAIREDEVFYLQSRGIPLPIAKRMLTEAFLLDPIEKLRSHRLRRHALILAKKKIEKLVQS